MLIGISTQDYGKTVDDSMQLYSIEKRQQQMLEGHASGFISIIIDDLKGPQGVS